MTEHERDPLDELREADSWKTKKFYNRIADAWQAEREKHERELSAQEHASDAEIDRLKSFRLLLCDELKQERATNHHDELVDVEAERDELCEIRDGLTDRCAELETEVGDLKAKLDVRETECASCIMTNTNTLQKENAYLKAKLDASMPLPLDADGVPCRIGDEMEYRGKNFVVRAVNSKFVIDKDCLSWLVKNDCHHVAPKPETKRDIEIDICNHDFTDESDNVFCQSIETRAYECGKRDAESHVTIASDSPFTTVVSDAMREESKYATGGYISDPSVISGGDAS